jgi:hypothetical protein
VAMGRSVFRTKLECALDSKAKGSRVLSQGRARSLRYRAEDNYRRIGVAFWIQRRCYLTPAHLKRMLAGLEPLVMRGGDEGLENPVRVPGVRLRRPGYFEQLQYGLDWNGDPLEPPAVAESPPFKGAMGSHRAGSMAAVLLVAP